MFTKRYRTHLLLNALLLVSGASAANILGVVMTPSYSHHVVFKPLWRELSLRGHQVTTITTHPLKDPKLVNLTEIDLSGFLDPAEHDRSMRTHLGFAQKNAIGELRNLFSIMSSGIDRMLDYGPIKKLINDKEVKFDLLVVEYLWPAPLAFAHRFNCPMIGMLSMDGSSLLYRTLGNPTHSSLYPDYGLPFGDKLSLWQRVVSFVFDYGLGAYLSDVFRLDQKVVAKHFGDDYPPLEEIGKNISMLFVNADPIFHHNRPLVPTVVQIGSGSHRSTPKALPKMLQSTLDDASEGFIYFSLGSNMKSEFLPANTMEVLLSVFSELPYTVLWKLGEEITNKSENVIVSKWLPQEDVLRHPNCKLFITQGGLQSMDEAIYSHVPMIGMPVFGDQFYNVKKLVNKGMGLELDYQHLEREHFKKTVLEVINNPRYRTTVKELAEVAQDQPMSGLEKAVWWTEYVIRHKGARHLRSPLLDIPWYQYLLLDVIGVLLLGVSVTLYSLVSLVRWLIRLTRRRYYSVSFKHKSS